MNIITANYFPKYHSLVHFYDGDGMCSVWGRNLTL